MVKIVFVDPDGKRHEVDAEEGMSLMEAAVKNMVPGIDADCGGACACATCHVYVDPSWKDRLASLFERSEAEEDMLDFAFDVRENSRLSCQIRVTAEMEGLVLQVPEQQG